MAKTAPIARLLFALTATLASTTPALAAEWFVRAGATGDGQSKENPAGDVAAVLALCRRGDVVNVAAGEYHGRAGTGEFLVNVPNLTLVGGWNPEFTERHPFRHVTLLRRRPGITTGVNYTNTEGGIIATTPDAHGDGRSTSCSGLIVDGFVLDGSTRNSYNPSDGRLGPQGSWKESLIKLTASDFYSSANIRIRNCVLMNGYNHAIEIKWQGDQNEVVNCLIFNNMIAGVDCRSMAAAINSPGAVAGYPETAVTIRNTTIAFNWDHDKAQMATGVLLGGGGRAVLENNVLAYLTGVSGQALRGLGPRDVARGNVLFVTTDAEQLTQAQATRQQTGSPARRDDEEEGGPAPAAANVADNVIADPGFAARVERGWLTNFTGFALKFGKLPLEVGNACRQAAGLSPIDKVGAALPPTECAWGVAYPVDMARIIPALVADQAGKGFRPDGPFETYAARPDPATLLGAVPGRSDEYQEITWEALQRGATPLADGTRVKFRAALRDRANRWGEVARGLTLAEYVHFELGQPGGNNRLFGYAVRGGQAGNRWNEFGSRGARGQTQQTGVWVRGMVYGTAQSVNAAVPYMVVVDYIGQPGS